jgi:hypothetical protein
MFGKSFIALMETIINIMLIVIVPKDFKNGKIIAQ